MNELIPYTIFGSGVLFGIMILALFILFIITDIKETVDYAFFGIIVAIGLNYFWGTFPLLSIFTLKNIGIYLFLGFIFSIIRTYFKGKELKKMDQERESRNTAGTKFSPTLREQFQYSLKDHVFRWWLFFPISIITWVFGNLLLDLFSFIYDKIGWFYKSVLNA